MGILSWPKSYGTRESMSVFILRVTLAVYRNKTYSITDLTVYFGGLVLNKD